MSDPRPSRVGKAAASSASPPPFPTQFYPMPGGYQGPPWFPGQGPAGPPPPWGAPPPPWNPPAGFPQAPVSAWSSPPGAMMASGATSTTAPMPSDEYTVDTMRRIYNDDDGRVEIQRVKVQRRPPEAPTYPNGPDALSVVPVGAFPLNERRPPPRKKKQLQLMQAAAAQSPQGPQGPQGQAYPWYPYMPCMPYPMPYPYYYGGCMWSPGAPTWTGNEESERTSSRQESLPTSFDSQRLDSRTSDPLRGSVSPVSGARSPSPAAASQVTDPHSLAPSDSVSMRGYERESSLERALMCPTPPPRTRSRAGERKASTDVGNPNDWMFDMQKAITGAGDVADASSDVVRLPPRRKHRPGRIVDVSDDRRDQSSDKQSITSVGSEDLLSSELTYAFRKLERSVDAFKTKISNDSTPVQTPQRMPSPPPPEEEESSGERTPTMEDASMTLDVVSVADKTDTTLGKCDTLSEPSSPPPLETLPSLSLGDAKLAPAPKEEAATTKGDDGPSSLTTSETSSSATSVATTLQTSEVSAAKPAESEQKSTTTPEKKEIATPETQPSTEGKVVTPPAEAKTAKPTEKTPAANEKETEAPKPTEKEPKAPTTSEKDQKDIATAEKEQKVPTASENEQKSAEKEATATEKASVQPPPSAEVKRILDEEVSGRESRASDSTFFSIRASDDLLIDTDSTDILLPTTDATTADEGEDHPDSTVASPTLGEEDEGYHWVLQQPGETPELTGAKEDEQRNAWRAEVSLWRARLVVSLCRGRGLDCQDWSTFHLLVSHPLTLDLKLSLLHAPRLCAANSTIGAALVRVALIHLAQYGETLLQPDSSRQTGWRSIKVDPNQSWAPVKGALELLQALGYKRREEGILRYPRRSGTEVSVLARLTLDMLVLAEELRLYLTGLHQYPTNVSDLFFSATSPLTTSPDPSLLDLQRPQSSASSYSFMSAQSTASFDIRPESRASVTDEETDTLQPSVKPLKGAKKPRRDSSSEEEVTLREDLKGVKDASAEELQGHLDLPMEEAPMMASEVLRKKDDQRPGSTLSLPMSPIDRSSLSTMTSMPDLQSIRSSTGSRGSQHRPSSTATAATTSSAGNDNPEDHVYEEIDVIRAQVQALRSASVPAQSPPPLPPKKKVSSEDDSGHSTTYPKMEWNSASTPSSLRGGSTGARRKKRRAPMPPDFMPPGWRTYQNRPLPDTGDQESEANGMSEEERKKKEEYRRSLNPFYEDLDAVKEKVKELDSEDEKNPFASDDPKVAGYVGKNPFYEDVEPLKAQAKEMESKRKKDYEKVRGAPKADATPREKYAGMGSLVELQDESVLIKLKRKAPPPPPTPDPTSSPALENGTDTTTSKETEITNGVTQTTDSVGKTAYIETETISIVTQTTTPAAKPPSAPSTPRESQRSSSIPLVSADAQSATNQTPTPKGPPTPSNIDAPVNTDATPEPSKVDAPKKEEENNTVENEEVKPAIPVKLRNLEKKKNANAAPKPDTPKVDETQTSSQPQKGDNEAEKAKEKDVPESSSKTEEARQVVSKAIKTHQQRTQLTHPKTPPPPPPSSAKPRPPSASVASDTKTAEDSVPRSVSAPPPTPTTNTLSFLDEIPYMDANEVKAAEPKVVKGKDQQYEVVEAPGKDTPPVPLSPTVMRQTALLLRGSRPVPFIDESDLPPDCPPPPPPGPPPDSPPTSPPETPHNSPPETPHTSPPETPEGSPVPSPITVPPITSLEKKVDSDKPTQTKESKDTSKDASQTPERKDKPPALPPKTGQSSAASKSKTETAQASAQSKASEEQQSKPQPSPEAKEKLPDQPSVRSSMSEDRYEIPEISDAQKSSPEDPKKPLDVPEQPKETVVEERYEIPEVVKETALNGGASNVPLSFLGPVTSSGRRNLEAVFGPPKPPRRRRNHHSPPPPRPPKSSSMEASASSSSEPKLPPKAQTLRPSSTTSSFSTTSGTTGSSSAAPTPASVPATPASVPATPASATPRPLKREKGKAARKSWPFILCDCLYANCRNYDDAK